MDQSPSYWRRDYSILVDPSTSNCGTLPFYVPSFVPDYCFITIQSITLLQLTHYNFIIDGKMHILFNTIISSSSTISPSSSASSSAASASGLIASYEHASLKMQSGHLVSEYSWLLDNIAQKMYRFDYRARKVKVFNSKNFYTNGQGYLMQLICTLNTTRDSNGTIDLEMVILEGNYDHLLPWPFNDTVELVVQNIRDDRLNIKELNNHTEIVTNFVSASSNNNSAVTDFVDGEDSDSSYTTTTASSEIVVRIVPSQLKEHGCSAASFKRPFKANIACGKKSIISFQRYQRSDSEPIKLGDLMIKMRIYQ